MSAPNDFESALWQLIFNNTAIANLGDAAGLRATTTAGSLYVALHSADPGEAGSQSTSELSYTGYARVPVARSGAGFTVSGTAPTQVVNAGAVTFGMCTAGGPQTATHFSIGIASSGATMMLVSAALNSSLVINTNITPSFAAGQLAATID